MNKPKKWNRRFPAGLTARSSSEVAQALGISIQRVSQIEVNALKKLRKVCRKMKMHEFL